MFSLQRRAAILAIGIVGGLAEATFFCGVTFLKLLPVLLAL